MTESELVELAARALLDTDNPYLGHQFPKDEHLARWSADIALTAINLPQMLEVVAAARAVTETKETARLAQNTRVQELNARGQQYYDRVVEWIAADHAHDEALKHLAISLDPLDPS